MLSTLSSPLGRLRTLATNPTTASSGRETQTATLPLNTAPKAERRSTLGYPSLGRSMLR
jgi:hypothetical protein